MNFVFIENTFLVISHWKINDGLTRKTDLSIWFDEFQDSVALLTREMCITGNDIRVMKNNYNNLKELKSFLFRTLSSHDLFLLSMLIFVNTLS